MLALIRIGIPIGNIVITNTCIYAIYNICIHILYIAYMLIAYMLIAYI